ncbi:SDR family oxidoreductase [Chachezhania sediminis]|uniref:SDR family oxidoreductase n=1 Tax=Chachezhania sediminis TaxID=2599291 RepID=UPI001E52AB7E|nr:SDR family oxidoreductase [Chachezhania sediminis]
MSVTGTFDGKTVLITGASRGIGASAAELFARAGANVVMAARSDDALQEVRARIDGAAGRAVIQLCDVSKYDDLAAAVGTCVDRFGGLDILINNAGVIAPISRMAEADPEGWGQAIDINLKGVFYGMRAALPVMLKAGGGTVLTISSGAAHNPIEAWSHYCSSKAGAAMLTRMLDAEYGPEGIRAIGLSPGTVATEMQREIKASAINPVSRLEWTDHIPPDWPARTLMWMCGAGADDWLGQEISLRDPEIRQKVGLA